MLGTKQIQDVRGMNGLWPVPVPSPVSQFLRNYSKPNIQPGDVLENIRDDFDSIRGPNGKMHLGTLKL